MENKKQYFKEILAICQLSTNISQYMWYNINIKNKMGPSSKREKGSLCTSLYLI